MASKTNLIIISSSNGKNLELSKKFLQKSNELKISSEILERFNFLYSLKIIGYLRLIEGTKILNLLNYWEILSINSSTRDK